MTRPARRARVLLLLLACAGSPATSAAATTPFFDNVPFVPIDMGGGGVESALGDLNGDGRLDVVLASQGNRIAVRLGVPGGSFGPLALFPAGSTPIAVALGDLNGDLMLDVAVANFLVPTMSVLYGNGDGTFDAPVALPCGARPVAVTIADVDLDGRLDLISANDTDNTLTLYRSQLGGFAPRADIATGGTPVAVAVARLDADLVPDLAVASFTGNVVRIHRGLGAGAFAAPTTLAAESTPNAILARDLDGDGDTDLLVGNFSACCSRMVSVFRGHGDGTFAARTNHGQGDQVRGLAVADLDSDGLLEILVSNDLDDMLSVLQGAGGWGFAGQMNTPAGNTPRSIALADLDGDGPLDAVVASGSGVALLRGASGGGFGPFQTASMVFAVDVAVGDLNGDGAGDLVGGLNNGWTGVALGNGDGTYQGTSYITAGLTRLALARLNDDAILDLVGTNACGCNNAFDEVGVMLGNGDGTFGPRVNHLAGFGLTGFALGDVNGDGRLDAVMTLGGGVPPTHPGDISVLIGNGDGTFEPRYQIHSSEPGWSDPALADLDLDGDLDLVTLGGDNPISMFRGHGDGQFDPPEPVPTGLTSLTVLAVLHFDGDTKPDLAVGDDFSGIEFHAGLGNGSFAPPHFIPTNGGLSELRAGDLDGDGHADLAWTFGHMVSVGRGNGTGGLAEQHVYGTGSNAQGIAIGDLNGDPRPDLVVACTNSNFVHPLLNAHTGYPTPTQVALADVDVTAERVRLTWFGDLPASLVASVERRTEQESWRSLSRVTPDGAGSLRWEDRDVVAGARYAYRLAWSEAGEPRTTAETWVSVPTGAAFALFGARPQPASQELRIAFSLPTGDRALLELFDVGGRALVAREVGTMGPGEHVVDLGSGRRFPAGVYVVRLSQGGRSEVARLAVVE